MASSLISDLRRCYPDASITVFLSKANKGIAELVDGIDRVVVVDVVRPHKALRDIRSVSVDILLDTGPWPRINSLLSFVARSKFTVGFKTPRQYRHYIYDCIALHREDRHEQENFRDLVRALGIVPVGQPTLKETGAVCPDLPEKPYVVFHPWASGHRFHLREWPAERWAALAAKVREKGYEIVMTGGPSDKEKSLELAKGFNVPPVILAGRTSMAQAVDVLKKSRLVISVNTGIMHVAAALGVPLIALHGPTNPKRWGPLSDAAVVLGPGPEEGGAFLNLGFEYPPNPPDCMGMIEVEDVWQAAQTLLLKEGCKK